ncbi:MAG: hypothetical protein GY799_19930 [Desulfobulbaceae bacterium]|nr:hypothetical protein [Desulfobulbaceae bacterium]
MEIEENIGKMVEGIVYFCTHKQHDSNFFSLEKELHNYLSELGCLFLQLMLISFQEKFDYSTRLKSGLYYLGDTVPRTIKTIYGGVRYWRNYVTAKDKKGRGFYPLDRAIGFTKDGFSPFVMNLAVK